MICYLHSSLLFSKGALHVIAGPGQGKSCGAGSGGSYGGRGGHGLNTCPTPGVTCQSNAFGNAYLPIHAGSGGGSCVHSAGAPGGAAVKVISRGVCIEGTIESNGATTSGGAGGGAGGAVWLDADALEGWGNVYSSGGAGASHCGCTCIGCCGTHYGGGGSGGRIRTYGQNYTSKALLYRRQASGGAPSYNNPGEAGTLTSDSGKLCSGHGTWNESLQTCECQDGFIGSDCQFLCNASSCGEHGVCTDVGTCQCQAGYVGQTCRDQCDRDTDCSGHGECSECGQCVCDPCFHGPGCSQECGGRGKCYLGQCYCDDCHVGEFCTSECSGNGECRVKDDSTMVCECAAGWTGSKCSIPTCPGEGQVCSGRGLCVSITGRCFCQPGWTGKMKKILSFNYHFFFLILYVYATALATK